MSIKFIQLPTCRLAEFVSSSSTSFDVSGFLYNDGTTKVDPADIGDICYATIEPKTAREELISFTIDSVTTAGVATLTVVRGLSQKSPYGTGGASFDHQNGVDFVISNNPGLLNKFAIKANDETVTGQWSFPDPTADGAPVTKSYFEDTLDPTLVHATGAEEIAGVKTFTSSPVVPDATADDEAASKGQMDALDVENVKLTGDQTVAGVKTFSSSPIVPTATADTQAINKAQAEAYVAANSGDIKASDSAYGTTKLDVAADTPSDPKALTATQDRQDAINGGGDFGTPSSTNKFVTEEKARLIDSFGTGADGDVEITGTVTLTSDKNYDNLTITGTLITDGYVVYVKNTLDGVGTIKHSEPSEGVGGDGTSGTGAGGGSGASSGTVLIYASNWAGTFTIESIGSDGGDGALAGNTSGGAGAAGAVRGGGVFVGAPGETGGDGVSGTTNGINGTAGDAANPSLSTNNGASGGDGGYRSGSAGSGGDGGAGGAKTAPSTGVTLYKFLATSMLGLKSDGTLVKLIPIPGSGSGGSGSGDTSPNSYGGGGGGAGGNGGVIVVIYKNKTWTGSTDVSGGAAGSGGAPAGSPLGTAGSAGSSGNSGVVIELDWNQLI